MRVAEGSASRSEGRSGEVLKDIGLSPREPEVATTFFLRHGTETLKKQNAFRHDEDAFIESARNVTEELKELLNSDTSA